jgi:hypothetical protein
MCFSWVTTRYKVILTIKLDWQNYQKGEYTLPPKELGRCTDWRFEVSADEKTAIFTASWDKRRIDENAPFNDINEKIKPYIYSGNSSNFS